MRRLRVRWPPEREERAGASSAHLPPHHTHTPAHSHLLARLFGPSYFSIVAFLDDGTPFRPSRQELSVPAPGRLGRAGGRRHHRPGWARRGRRPPLPGLLQGRGDGGQPGRLPGRRVWRVGRGRAGGDAGDDGRRGTVPRRGGPPAPGPRPGRPPPAPHPRQRPPLRPGRHARRRRRHRHVPPVEAPLHAGGAPLLGPHRPPAPAGRDRRRPGPPGGRGHARRVGGRAGPRHDRRRGRRGGARDPGGRLRQVLEPRDPALPGRLCGGWALHVLHRLGRLADRAWHHPPLLWPAPPGPHVPAHPGQVPGLGARPARRTPRWRAHPQLQRLPDRHDVGRGPPGGPGPGRALPAALGGRGAVAPAAARL